MKVTLPLCEHRTVLTYKVTGGTRDDIPRQAHTMQTHRGLCQSCFVRVVKHDYEPRWTEDKPAGGDTCPHESKQEITSKVTANKPYRNAICNTCGAGLRALNDTEDWHTLREYRFIIEEHP
jgi:hypothetical protein